jgi:hypothetical protein
MDFYGVTDPDDIEWMKPRLTPHPWRCFDDPLVLHNAAEIEKLPRTIINCTSTLEIRKQAGFLDRAFDAERVWEIDTGHDLMISEPEKVAEMLLRLASL